MSGTASWAYFTAAQYILGIQPEYKGISINPCIPADWKGFTASRRYRGVVVNFKVVNPKGVEKGVAKVSVNGEEIKGNFIPAEKLTAKTEVLVVMG